MAKKSHSGFSISYFSMISYGKTPEELFEPIKGKDFLGEEGVDVNCLVSIGVSIARVL